MELATEKKKKKQNTDRNAECLISVFLSIPKPTKFLLSFIFKAIASIQFAYQEAYSTGMMTHFILVIILLDTQTGFGISELSSLAMKYMKG